MNVGRQLANDVDEMCELLSGGLAENLDEAAWRSGCAAGQQREARTNQSEMRKDLADPRQ